MTTINLVPTMMVAMLAHAAFSPADRCGRCVGHARRRADPTVAWRRAETELGIVAIVGYGMTRRLPHLTVSHDDDPDLRTTCGRRSPASRCGSPMPEPGRPARPGRSARPRRGARTRCSATRTTPRPPRQGARRDGWLHTGDLGSLDERGYLSIDGRASELIIRGGENVYPREVEDVLRREEGVAEVAVISLPDESYGEIVAAFVRLRAGRSDPPRRSARRCASGDRRKVPTRGSSSTTSREPRPARSTRSS